MSRVRSSTGRMLVSKTRGSRFNSWRTRYLKCMAILEIKKFKDPVLRKRCKKIRKVNDKIKKLIVDMAQTMEKGQGIGLAAPQVGILKRIIVVKTDLQSQRILALINPKIVKKSREKEKGEEGCLSFPGIFLEIKRAEEVKVKAIDING